MELYFNMLSIQNKIAPINERQYFMFTTFVASKMLSRTRKTHFLYLLEEKLYMLQKNDIFQLHFVGKLR